jgi:hypothetical protein
MKSLLVGLMFFVLYTIVTAQQADSQKSVYVYISFSEVCPLCIEMVPTIKSIIQKNDRWCEFTLVLTNTTVNKQKLNKLLKEFPVKPILVFDSMKTVSKRFGFTVTPEVVVENDDNEIVYSGAIDDRFVDFGKSKKHSIIPYLSSALEEIFEGKKPQIVSTKAFGCYISYKNATE